MADQQPITEVSGPPQDPWYWTVDQVMFALTDKESLLLQSNASLSLPHTEMLARKLRENDVNGLALLTVVEGNSLRDDLGIKSMSHRASINHLIRLLKDMSSKYKEHYTLSERASSIGIGSRIGTPFLGSPQKYEPRATSIASEMWRSPVGPYGLFQTLPGIEGVIAPTQEQAPGLKRDILAEALELPRPEQQSLFPSTYSEGLGIGNLEAIDDTIEPREAGEADAYPNASNSIHDETRDNEKAAAGLLEAQSKQQIRQGETTIIDDNGRKRRRLVLVQCSASQPAEMNGFKIASGEVSFGSSIILQKDGEDGNLLKAMVLPGAEIPALQDEESLAQVTQTSITGGITLSSPDHPKDLAEPGTLLIDKHGRKRVRPILVTQPEHYTEENNQIQSEIEDAHHIFNASTQFSKDIEAPLSLEPRAFGRKASRRKDQIYLGPEPLSVDELFYGDFPLETRLDKDEAQIDQSNDTDDFIIMRGAMSSTGLCAYVNSRMKYYLQSQQMMLKREGKGYVGLIPYPNRIGRKHYALSMTIISKSTDGISAWRSNRSRWIEDSSVPVPNISGEDKANIFNVADPALAQDESEDLEWRTLEKWKYIDGKDEVLPIYGESGSEGEYELDTWREMEKERGELERPMGTSKSRKLTGEEVEEAINIAVKQIFEDWSLKKKPKLEPKAWRLWVKSRREGNVKAQIDSCTEKIGKLDDRIANHRKRIAKEEWSQLGQLKKQCQIMQPSIFDREDHNWRLDTWRLQKMPEMLLPAPRKAKASNPQKPEDVLKDDEENLSSDLDTSEGSDGSLDDFIVEDEVFADDHQHVIIEDDFTMADVEDAADSDTLAGVDDSGVAQQNNELKVEPLTQTDKKLQNEAQPKASKQPDIVDLTQDPDPLEPDTPAAKLEPSFAIRTPSVDNSGNDSEVFQRSRSKKAVYKQPLSSRTVIDLGSGSADSTAAENFPMRRRLFPAFDDVEEIRGLDPSELVERQDRKRLLIWVIAHTPPERREAASIYLTQISLDKSFTEVTAGLKALLEYKQRIPGLDKEKSDSIMSIASWQVCWTIPVKIGIHGLHSSHIETTLADEEGYEPFYDFMLECLSHYQNVSGCLDVATPSKKRQKILWGGSTETLHGSPLRQRKYAVTESQETLNKRRAAQDRVRGAEERRRREELKSRLTNMRSNADGSQDVVINPGKLEEQEFIYLNPKFGNGAQIKPHQKEGLQFLWREITAEQEDQQGCLLAQTMGLGKTMQVIALLFTLSEAARSSNKNVRLQVPHALRESQTLVLCPPALLENWWDEFILWVPKPLSDSIGELRKVSVSLKPADRLSEIYAWSETGGVLLIGYDTFKALIHNKARPGSKTKILKAPLDEEQHERVKEALLDRASLVIADEAHQFKGRSSQINSAMNQFKTKSRVALTGSPLNNNLEEYYTLIDWIAPNYLGTYIEFKATYEEPIREGLYQDSTESQYRESRKRLKALELEMEPKVHRADISVLRTDLQGKMEFVVRVPLTKVQEEIYNIYVDSMQVAVNGKEPRPASLWSWLGVLQLLCNHPKCFRERMMALKVEMEAKSKAPALPKRSGPSSADEFLLASDEDASLLAESVSSTAFTQTISESEKVFQDLTEPLDALCLSNKMQILMNILDFSNDAQDKVLVFSHRIATLDYVEAQLVKGHQRYARIDGKSPPQKRQQITKDFNEGSVSICLISTRAGGTGLNLFGANRVVILDEHFNPTFEKQAIGRAYRIGQQKTVYVYHLTVGGTFEQALQNQALFKEQLATRVMDKRNPSRSALKGAGQYFFPPKEVRQDDLSELFGKDCLVLDRLLANQAENRITSITPSETFHIEDGVELTQAERREAEQMQRDEQLRRRDPYAYSVLLTERRARQCQTEMARQAKRLDSVMQHTLMTPSISGPLGYSLSSTQPLPGNADHVASGNNAAPPSSAPPFPANMGGLPYPESPTLGMTVSGNSHMSGLDPVLGTNTRSIRNEINPSAPPSESHSDTALPLLDSPSRFSQKDVEDLLVELFAMSKEDSKETEEALGQAVGNLLRRVSSAVKVPTSRERTSEAIQEVAGVEFLEIMSRKALENYQVAVPDPRAPLYAYGLWSLIQDRALDQNEHLRLSSGIKNLLEREGVKPKTLLKVMAEKLHSTKGIVPMSPKQSGTKPGLAKKNSGVGKAETKRAKPPGGMLSYLAEPDAATTTSRPQELSDGAGLSQNALSAKTSKIMRKHETNGHESKAHGERISSEEGTNRKHGLLSEESNQIKKGKRTSKDRSNFISTEEQFAKLLSREAARPST